MLLGRLFPERTEGREKERISIHLFIYFFQIKPLPKFYLYFIYFFLYTCNRLELTCLTRGIFNFTQKYLLKWMWTWLVCITKSYYTRVTFRLMSPAMYLASLGILSAIYILRQCIASWSRNMGKHICKLCAL